MANCFTNSSRSIYLWIGISNTRSYHSNFVVSSLNQIELLIQLQGGQHILNLIDFYGVSFVALVLALPELITFGWIYGVERLWLDVKFMRNAETGLYYRLTWKIISPLLMLIILIYQVVQFESISYNGQKYPVYVTGTFAKLRVFEDDV